MEYYISKNILGTSKSLIQMNDGTVAWSAAPDYLYSLGDFNALIEISELARLLGVSIETSIAPAAHIKAFQELGVPIDDVEWPVALAPDIFYNRLRKITEGVSDVLCSYADTNYGQTFQECKKFLRSLSRCSVDIDKIHKYIDECKSGPSVKSSLRSFLPPQGEYKAPKVIYSQTSTSTGRLVVDAGPSILTLPAKNRDILRSSVGGKIFQVDFVSLEPRVMLYAVGKESADDIYSDIGKKLFNSEIDRKVVKLATLSALYGSSYHSISEIIGNKEASKNVVRRVRQYFEVDQLERGLMQILHEEKQIANYYGRPLKIEDPRGNILISHYVQSTAVDTALLGFSKLMNVLSPLKIVPIYVIHDAVVVDVPMDKIDVFNEICSKGVKLPLGEFKFDVTQLSSNGV